MTNKEIAAKINTLRKEANLTQVNFGKEVIHVSQATASKKLNGQIPFSVEEIFECAERFNVSTEYLYGREKEENLGTRIEHLKSSSWTNCSSHPGGG